MTPFLRFSLQDSGQGLTLFENDFSEKCSDLKNFTGHDDIKIILKRYPWARAAILNRKKYSCLSDAKKNIWISLIVVQKFSGDLRNTH